MVKLNLFKKKEKEEDILKKIEYAKEENNKILEVIKSKNIIDLKYIQEILISIYNLELSESLNKDLFYLTKILADNQVFSGISQDNIRKQLININNLINKEINSFNYQKKAN